MWEKEIHIYLYYGTSQYFSYTPVVIVDNKISKSKFEWKLQQMFIYLKVMDYNLIVPLILLFKTDFNLKASRNVFLGSSWVDRRISCLEILRSSCSLCSSYSKACVLKFFGAFGLNPMNLQLIKVLELSGAFRAWF